MKDTIYRQAAIDMIMGQPPEPHYPTWYAEQIKELPSAQPERKTGRWIERNPNNSPDCRLIECSECGNAYIVDMGLLLEDWAEGRNFCIRCGARMEKGGEDG